MNQSLNSEITALSSPTSHDGCGAEKGLITVDQALKLMLDHTQSLSTESLALNQALNRYLAQDIYSEIELPLFSQSAVDGYAIFTGLQTEPVGTQFELIGEIRAGQTADIQLKQGQAVRIFTGAKIPENTTTVARQEIVQVNKLLDSTQIELTDALHIHADIRDVGEEVSLGQLLAEAGQCLNVGAIAALSMAGVKAVEVFQYPKIAVVITGDEVAENVEDLASGKIFDANAPLIQSWFHSHNQNVDLMHVADTELAVTELFERLKNEYDIILTTGGVSVGDYDFVRPVALSSGFEQIFWKVKQKPGKPIFFAQYSNLCNKSDKKNSQNCYLLGLPGNPAAVYVGMQIYTTTLIQSLQGQSKALNWFSAELQHDLKMDRRERFLRMRADVDQTKIKVKSLAKQQSHMLSNLMFANCIVRIPENENLSAGDTVYGVFI